MVGVYSTGFSINIYGTFAFADDGYHVEKKDILPLKVRTYDEYEILLPNNVVNVARYLYGRRWKYPDTGWRWLPEYKHRPVTLQAQLTDQHVAQLITCF